MMLRFGLVAAATLALVSRTTPSAAQCLGDFNGDGKVLVDELLTAAKNALNGCQLIGPRFSDNGDGTVTDHKTGLVWEQKDNLDGSANPSDPHDADNTYAWSSSGAAPDGSVFTAFVFGLNGGTSLDGVATSGCFAGHCDWRLPTVEELRGIVDLGAAGCGSGSPCIDPSVGPMQADGYWSATTRAGNPLRAWLVDYTGGDMAAGGKTILFFVRAVRGGR